MPPATPEYLSIANRTRGSFLGDRIRLADTSLSRFIGLLTRSHLSSGEGLLIRPSNGVHTLFMRFSIDVLLLDRDSRVLRSYNSLKPFRLTRVDWKAASALELPAGLIIQSQTQPGDQLQIDRRSAS